MGTDNRKDYQWTWSFSLKFIISIILSVNYSAGALVLFKQIGATAFLNFIDGLIWLLAASLIYFEYRRRLKQTFLGLRGFWIFYFIMSIFTIIKLSLDQKIKSSNKVYAPLIMFESVNLIFSLLLCVFTLIRPLDSQFKNEKSIYFEVVNLNGTSKIEKSKVSIKDLEIKEVRNRKIKMNDSKSSFKLSKLTISIKLILTSNEKQNSNQLMDENNKNAERLDRSESDIENREAESDVTFECNSKKNLDELLVFNESVLVKWRIEYDDEICPLMLILNDFTGQMRQEINGNDDSDSSLRGSDKPRKSYQSFFKKKRLSSSVQNNSSNFSNKFKTSQQSSNDIDLSFDFSPLKDIYLKLCLSNVWFTNLFYNFLDFKNLEIAEALNQARIRNMTTFVEPNSDGFQHDLSKHLYILNCLNFVKKPFAFKIEEERKFSSYIGFTLKFEKKIIQDKFNVYDLNVYLSKLKGCSEIDSLSNSITEYLSKEKSKDHEALSIMALKQVENCIRILLNDGFYHTPEIVTFFKIYNLVNMNTIRKDVFNFTYSNITNFRELIKVQNLRKFPSNPYIETFNELNLNEFDFLCEFIQTESGDLSDSDASENELIIMFKYKITAISKKTNNILSWSINIVVDTLLNALIKVNNKLNICSNNYLKSNDKFKKVSKQFVYPLVELLNKIKKEFNIFLSKPSLDSKSKNITVNSDSRRKSLIDFDSLEYEKNKSLSVRTLKSVIGDFSKNLNLIFTHPLYSLLLFDTEIKEILCIYYINTQSYDKVAVSSLEISESGKIDLLSRIGNARASKDLKDINVIGGSVKFSKSLAHDSNSSDSSHKKNASDKSSYSNAYRSVKVPESVPSQESNSSIINTLLKP